MALRLHTFYLKWRLGNIYETHVVTCTFTRIILRIRENLEEIFSCHPSMCYWYKWSLVVDYEWYLFRLVRRVWCEEKARGKKTVHKVSRSYFFSSRLYCFHFAHVPQFLLELWPPKIISCTKYVTFLLFLPPVTYTDYRGVCYSYTQFRVCLFLYET